MAWSGPVNAGKIRAGPGTNGLCVKVCRRKAFTIAEFGQHIGCSCSVVIVRGQYIGPMHAMC